MDPMIDFVRARTADLQRTAESVHRERDLRQPAAPLGVATIAGRLERPVPVPSAAPAGAAATTKGSPKAEGCAPCPPDTARRAA